MSQPSDEQLSKQVESQRAKRVAEIIQRLGEKHAAEVKAAGIQAMTREELEVYAVALLRKTRDDQVVMDQLATENLRLEKELDALRPNGRQGSARAAR